MKSLKFVFAIVSLLFCSALILPTEAKTTSTFKKGFVYRGENDIGIPIKRTQDIVVKKSTTTRIVQIKK